MESGWVKLHRNLMNKPIWICSQPAQKVILVTILMLANHEEKEWLFNGKKYICKPGQFITSLKSLADLSGTTVRSVRTAISNFQSTYDFLTSKPTNKNTLITITNWDFYQEVEKNRQADRQSTDTVPTTNKNDKNYKNLKNYNLKLSGIGVVNKNISENENPKSKKNIQTDKQKFGEKVFMTDKEYDKLIKKFGQVDADDKIENLDLYLRSNKQAEKKYDSHYATILCWERKNKADSKVVQFAEKQKTTNIFARKLAEARQKEALNDKQ